MNSQKTAGCPTPITLKNFLQGKLEPPQLDECESHVGECPLCHETLRGLNPDDTLSNYVASAMDEIRGIELESQSDSQQIASLVQRLTQPKNLLSSDEGQASTESKNYSRSNSEYELLADRAAEVLRCVSPDLAGGNLGTLGDYQLVSLLGAGSTGVVFHAIDKTLNRNVALKVLRPSLGSVARDRFMAEARVAASIEHKNVVTIYQVGQVDRLAFIAMQWLPGQTLESIVANRSQEPQMEEAETKRIVSQVAAGLAAAHRKQMVHRDIKPANIWICDDSDEVKILDFGLARIADDDPGLTATGMLAGTPNFMSPEQARGLELDGRSDLFSLGCVMYRLSTGRLPFGSATVLATLQSIQSDNPVPPDTVRAEVSDDFSDLTMSLLEKQPSNRPESADQLMQMLNLPRDQWPKPIVRYTDPATATKTRDAKTPHTEARTASRIGNRLWRWIAAALLVAIGIGAALNGQQIIRLVNDQGELVIDAKDESIEIEILQNGKLVEVVDTKTKQRLNIRSGNYEFRAAPGTGESQNSFDVTPDSLTMKRGGSTVLTVTKINRSGGGEDIGTGRPQSTLANASQPENPDNKNNKPIFNGRDFDHWYDIAYRDKHVETLCGALKACARLATTEDEKEKRNLVIRHLVRKHGSNIIGLSKETDKFHYAFIDAFTQQSPDEIIDFVLEEFKSGNTRSHSFCLWLTLIGTVYEGDGVRQDQHRYAIIRRGVELLDAAIKLVETSKGEKQSEAYHRILRAMCGVIPYAGHAKPRSDNETVAERVDRLSPNLRDWVKQKHFALASDSASRVELGELLVKLFNNDPKYYGEILKQLLSANASPEINDRYLGQLLGIQMNADAKAIALLLVLENQFEKRHGDLRSLIDPKLIKLLDLSEIDLDGTERVSFNNKFIYDKRAYQLFLGGGGGGGDSGGGGGFGASQPQVQTFEGPAAVARPIITELWMIQENVTQEFKEKTLNPVLMKLVEDNNLVEKFTKSEKFKDLKIVHDITSLVMWDAKAQKKKSEPSNTGAGGGLGAGGSGPDQARHYPDDISVFVKRYHQFKRGGAYGGGVF